MLNSTPMLKEHEISLNSIMPVTDLTGYIHQGRFYLDRVIFADGTDAFVECEAYLDQVPEAFTKKLSEVPIA